MTDSTFPRDAGTLRPYRLWNARTKKQVPYRYYANAKRAADAALIEVAYVKPGTSIEVFDISNGRHLGTFTSGTAGPKIWLSAHFRYFVNKHKVAA